MQQLHSCCTIFALTLYYYDASWIRFHSSPSERARTCTVTAVCLTDWVRGGHESHYNCHRGPPAGGGVDDRDVRFVFYYERHIQHVSASLHAHSNRARVAAAVERLVTATGSSAAEFSFVGKALDFVVKGQRIVASR